MGEVFKEKLTLLTWLFHLKTPMPAFVACNENKADFTKKQLRL